MKKIDFEVNAGICSPACPYNVDAMVGSRSCRTCISFVSVIVGDKGHQKISSVMCRRNPDVYSAIEKIKKEVCGFCAVIDECGGDCETQQKINFVSQILNEAGV